MKQNIKSLIENRRNDPRFNNKRMKTKKSIMQIIREKNELRERLEVRQLKEEIKEDKEIQAMKIDIEISTVLDIINETKPKKLRRNLQLAIDELELSNNCDFNKIKF